MAERAKSNKSKPKAKKDKARKPGPGHNSGAVPDEVWERHIRKIEATSKAMEKVKVEYDQKRGEHRSAFKAAKDDGVNIDALRIARDLEKQDAGVVVTNYSDVGRALRIMKSALAVQMDLFQAIEIPLPANATLAGQQAFKSGNERSTNPYRAGTEEFANFDGAWVAAQSSAVAEMDSSVVN